MYNNQLKRIHDCMLRNGFEFLRKDDEEHYLYTKIVEGMEFIYLLVTPHSGTNNRFMLRADAIEKHDRWSNCEFQRFYKDADDFEENWGKYLLFDEYDEMCN